MADPRGDAVQLEWLGINGFRFEFLGRTVLLDPYVTRNRAVLCDPECVRRHIPAADYVVISHSHWDHLADAHAIAAQTGATVVGSETTCSICESLGVPEEQLTEAEAFSRIACGDFAVTLFPSLHIVMRDGNVPYAGTYTSPPATPPASAPDYLEGNTFAVLFEFGETRILNIGSANVIEEHLRDTRPRVLLLGIAKWEGAPRYIERVMASTQPAMVIPTHYDRMDEPLERGITDRDPAAMDRFLKTMEKVAPSVEVRTLDYFEKLILPPRGKAAR